MKNVFAKDVVDELIARINLLTAASVPQWGKMGVAQMLAHCNVTYQLVYEAEKYDRPKGLKKFLLKLFVKPMVISTKPYKRNSPTSAEFLIKEDKNFEEEKANLIAYLQKTQELGASYFEGKESHAFGDLCANGWNNMFYKHLDHHLTQFGV